MWDRVVHGSLVHTGKPDKHSYVCGDICEAITIVRVEALPSHVVQTAGGKGLLDMTGFIKPTPTSLPNPAQSSKRLRVLDPKAN